MGQEFADERDVDWHREGNLLQRGGGEEFAREFVLIEAHVFGDLAVDRFLCVLDRLHLARGGTDRNNHAWADEERPSVHFFAIHLDVAVGDELLRAKDGRGKAEPVNYVVQTALEHLEEEVSSVALLLQSFSVVVHELLLADHTKDRLEFLPFFELGAEV